MAEYNHWGTFEHQDIELDDLFFTSITNDITLKWQIHPVNAEKLSAFYLIAFSTPNYWTAWNIN